MYLSDADWRSAVVNELEEAQIVLVQPGLSRGVHWELEHIRANCEPKRLLICLASYWGKADAYENMIALARTTLGVELPRKVPYMRGPGFVFFDSDWTPLLQPMSFKCPALWPLTGDGTNLDYSLQPFLQGVHGGEREEPREAKWAQGFVSWLTKGAALAISIMVIFLVITAVMKTGEVSRGLLGMETKAKTQETIRQDVSRLFNESTRIPVLGKAVPYQIAIPESLLPVPNEEPLIEHKFMSSDGRIHLTIVAHPENEDVSTMAAQRMKLNSGPKVKDTRLERTRTVEIAGVPWVESRIHAEMKDGMKVRELAYGNNSTQGTVFVFMQFFNIPDTDDPDMLTGYEILNSLRITN